MKQWPVQFLQKIEEQLGQDFQAFVEAGHKNARRSIRVNPHKIKSLLQLEKVPWHDQGFFLPENELVAYDPLFHAGCYYVQESSSMAVAAILKQLPIDKNSRILDLCASPGGKSTLVSALFPEAWVVANETVYNRIPMLSENIQKWGMGNVQVTNADAGQWKKSNIQFDLILLDAPCSGEGMFRKDETAVNMWSSNLVELCSARQKKITAEIWENLLPGGYLIYSTCTFNFDENERNIQWILNEFDDAEVVELSIDSLQNHQTQFENIPAFRFYFHQDAGEGLFVSVLRKKETHFKPNAIKSFSKPNKQTLPYLNQNRAWLNYSNQKGIFALPTEHAPFSMQVHERIKTLFAGVELGEEKAKNFVFHPALALSVHQDIQGIEKQDLSLSIALDYLGKKPVYEHDWENGMNLFTHQNQGLGFAKVIDKRINSFWPNEWRIRNEKPKDEKCFLMSEVME